jgi:hypothetical protein
MDGSKDFVLESLDANYVRDQTADLHTSMAYVDVGRTIGLDDVSLLSRESLDLLLRRGLRRPNFKL